jgi:hypothetical protein
MNSGRGLSVVTKNRKKARKKIVARITGDFTGFRAEFDCTKKVLAMPLEKIRSMADSDYQSDHLAPGTLVEKAHSAFTTMWGQGTKDMKFGFEVEVVDGILEYFSVESLDQITKCPNCNKFHSVTPEKSS